MKSKTTSSEKKSAPDRARWNSETRRWVVIALVVLLVIILFQIRETLTTFVLAGLLAYLLNPTVTTLTNRLRVSRLAAAAIVYLALILLIATASAILAPLLFDQIRGLGSGLDEILAQVQSAVDQNSFLSSLGIRLDSASLVSQLRSDLRGMLSAVPRVLIGAASGLFGIFVMLVFSFYLVKDADTLNRALDSAVPEPYRDDLAHIRSELDKIWSSFLRGQVMLSLIIGIVTTIVLAILGVRNAILLGALAGILEVVPNLGPILAMIPAILIALFQGSTHFAISNLTFALIVVLAYFLIQQLENHLIVPNVLGSSVNLPPIVILFGAFAGASLAGLLGIFLAAPVLATARLIGAYVLRKLFEPMPAK